MVLYKQQDKGTNKEFDEEGWYHLKERWFWIKGNFFKNLSKTTYRRCKYDYEVFNSEHNETQKL